MYLCAALSPPPTASQSPSELFFLLVKTNICRFALDKNKAIHLLCPATLSCKLRKMGSVKVYSSCGCLQWERHLSVRRVRSSQECILPLD